MSAKAQLCAPPSPKDFDSIGSWLTARVAHVKEQNPSTSFRSLAKRAGVSPSLVTMVAGGKRLPSDDVLLRLAQTLSLKSEELEFVSALAGLHRAKTPSGRLRQAARLRALKPTHSTLVMTLDQIEMIGHWRHVTILEMTQQKGFAEDGEKIAATLGSGTTASMVEDSLALLQRLGLLQRDATGRLRKAAGQVRSPIQLPSAAIRGFHKQMLQRAHVAIDKQSVKERFLASLTIPVPASRIEEIGRRIVEFRDQLAASLGDDLASADEVYHLNVQFFRATAQTQALVKESDPSRDAPAAPFARPP